MDLQNGHLSEIEVVNNDTFVTSTSIIYFQGCCGSDHILDLQLPTQSVPVTTKFESLNPTHGQMYSIQHYVIKFASDFRQVSDFLWVLQFPPPIKLTATI
jgi:hypothetical protein